MGRLARLVRGLAIVTKDGLPTKDFHLWWQSISQRVEALEPSADTWQAPAIDAPGGTITLPAGGRWSYFVCNNGVGVVGEADGGTVVYSSGGPPLINAFGFCWKKP